MSSKTDDPKFAGLVVKFLENHSSWLAAIEEQASKNNFLAEEEVLAEEGHDVQGAIVSIKKRFNTNQNIARNNKSVL